MLFVFYKTFRQNELDAAPFTWKIIFIFNLEMPGFIARHRLFYTECAKYFSLLNVIF